MSTYRFGPARLLSAPSLDAPVAAWYDHGESRGRIAVSIPDGRILTGRVDRFGRTPLSDAVHVTSAAPTFIVPLLENDIAHLAQVIEGAVVLTQGAEQALGFPSPGAVITPRAFAVVPLADFVPGQAWFGSEMTWWIVKGYLVVTGAFVKGPAEGDDVYADRVFECRIVPVAATSATKLAGHGKVWIGGVPVIGQTLVYEPAVDALMPVVGEGVGTFTRTGTATYIDDNDVIQTAATDTPRYQDGALLMENSATNKLTQSEDLTAADWTKVAATVSADALAAPDGAVSADKLIEDAANAQHYVQQGVGAAASQTYAFSCFVRAAERTYVALAAEESGAAGNRAEVVINASTGAVASTAATGDFAVVRTHVRKVSGDFWRVTLVFTCGALSTSTTVLARASLHDGATDTYQGDGASGLYLWGFQFEADFLTSYIPTTTAAVTRNADSLALTYSKVYDQSKGLSIYIKYQAQDQNYNDTPITVGADSVASPGNGLGLGTGGTRVRNFADIQSFSFGAPQAAALTDIELLWTFAPDGTLTRYTGDTLDASFTQTMLVDQDVWKANRINALGRSFLIKTLLVCEGVLTLAGARGVVRT